MATSMGCKARNSFFRPLLTDKIFHIATFVVIIFALGVVMTSDHSVTLIKKEDWPIFFIMLSSPIIMSSMCIISGASLLIAYLTGCLGVNFVLRSGERKFPNIFLLRKKCKLVGSYNIPQQCTVCGNMKCRRHRPDLNVYVSKPWTDLMIPHTVDESLEEILSLTLNEYIYSWHKMISADESFIQELRTSLRFVISSLLTRIMQVDVIDIITDKLAKALLQHLDCYLHAKDRSKSVELSQQMVLNYYGSSLHVALKSREAEVQYLRNLVEMLLPHCLPKKFLLCRSSSTLTREVFSISVLLPAMDVIADPDTVNHLVLILFDKTPMRDYPDNAEQNVELLNNFINANASPNKPVLQTDLRTILSTQNLLFPFMQFLKEEVSVNVLQFCLDIDDFSTRILNPDLNKDRLKELQKEAKNMYNTYFSSDAVDKIKFPDEVAKQFRDVIHGPIEDVIKLRTTTPLYKAYDHAYNLLENTFCPMFHQSDRYFRLLCGERWSSAVAKNLNRIPKKGSEISAMTKLSHRIKGVFVPSIDEGQFFEEEAGTDLAMTDFSDDALSAELYEENRLDDDPRLKNLSAWRVSVPSVETLMDQNCKYYNAFTVEVQRIDVKGKDNPEDFHWLVKRRYHEFYVLEAKLREFHGELPDIQLPPKRSIGNKSKQFLESRRIAFEKFLQDLLSLPTLQSSELLYRFLKSPVMFTAGFLPEINLGKMIKTVPMKLIKEKGQHLELFLQAFIASTEATKPKPSKLDLKDIYEVATPPVVEKIQRSMYGDNNPLTQSGLSSNFLRPRNIISLDGIYDYLLYLAVRVYQAPNWWIQIMNAFDAMIRHTFQGFVEWYLDRKIKQVLKPQRIVEVINLLRDALFFHEHIPRTESQKKQRAVLALKQAKEFFPDLLVWMLGHARHEEGTKLLLSALQHPLLNKQLSYVLLDIVVLELFPELRLKSES